MAFVYLRDLVCTENYRRDYPFAIPYSIERVALNGDTKLGMHIDRSTEEEMSDRIEFAVIIIPCVRLLSTVSLNMNRTVMHG